MKNQLKCYIYTRVSTSMQVDGYSLDAQKDKLHKYADYQDMIIAGEYSDEGKSGKSVEGRPQFQQMLQDIETGKDNIDFVLVFKLSRFGRNAADVLSSLQRMQDFGVNLICVEDGIDSSKDAGKLIVDNTDDFCFVFSYMQFTVDKLITVRCKTTIPLTFSGFLPAPFHRLYQYILTLNFSYRR